MTTVLKVFPAAKSKVSVAAVQWLPGALSATLPLFAVDQANSPNTLFLRADDPNIYGVLGGNLTQVPVVEYNSVKKAANKGRNYYSAPWCISTFPARDTGKRIAITTVDDSVFQYISALYNLLGAATIALDNWKLEKGGFVKVYQTLQGSSYYNAGGTIYFGGTDSANNQVSGVGVSTSIQSPLITDDFTYNSPISIPTLQMTYNTFCAVDTPIVISAIDMANPGNGRIYFTLMNNVTMYNGPNYP